MCSQHMHHCNACRRMELQRNRSRKRASEAPRMTSLPRDLSKDEGVTAAGVSECSTGMLCSWVFTGQCEHANRFDEEGLPIYSTEELNVGKGGSTAACPFECECCF